MAEQNGSLNCWKCGKTVSEVPAKIGFRASCLHCNSDLHVCLNCRYYARGKPNDCLVPETDPVKDRESSNLCEEFKVKIAEREPKQSSKTHSLLGEPEKKKDFNSLFKDDNQ